MYCNFTGPLLLSRNTIAQVTLTPPLKNNNLVMLSYHILYIFVEI